MCEKSVVGVGRREEVTGGEERLRRHTPLLATSQVLVPATPTPPTRSRSFAAAESTDVVQEADAGRDVDLLLGAGGDIEAKGAGDLRLASDALNGGSTRHFGSLWYEERVLNRQQDSAPLLIISTRVQESRRLKRPARDSLVDGIRS